MRKTTRKEEIIKVAAKLFKEKGYSAVTMRDIAKVVGVKAASLYNHISSKQDILATIIISLAEEFTEDLEEIQLLDSTSLEKTRRIIMHHIDITHRHTYEMAALNNDWMHLEEQLDYYLLLRTAYESNFREIIIEGIKRKEIVDTNPEVVLFSVLSTLRSLYLWMPKKEDVDYKEIRSDLSRVLINGIKR